jgi:hypothetical protein
MRGKKRADFDITALVERSRNPVPLTENILKFKYCSVTLSKTVLLKENR